MIAYVRPSEVLGKQQQNNNVLKRVVDTLELDTYLAFGDHGMDRKGEYDGVCDLEDS
jgi:hypothetical protein